MEQTWEDQIYGLQPGQLEEQLMEIPLTAPYLANQEDFQAVNTRFEKNGTYYRAIKQRYQNDTLQVVYVRDTARKALETTVKSWISSITDDQLPQDQNGKSLVLVFAKDYLEPEILQLGNRCGMIAKDKIGFIFSAYMSPYFTLDGPPPQFS